MPPTPLPLTSVLTALAAGAVGYYLGKTSGLRTMAKVQDLTRDAHKTRKSGVADENEFGVEAVEKGVEEDEEEEDEEEEDEDDSDSEDCQGKGVDGIGEEGDDTREELKMVLIVRPDLQMTKGKIAAQCGHATLACYKAALKATPNRVRRWERYGQAKIALKAEGGEDGLNELRAIAMSLGVVAQTIHDAGRTQIAAGSATVLGVGPAPRSLVDQISGHLKLL